MMKDEHKALMDAEGFRDYMTFLFESYKHDQEVMHDKMDELMCALLRSMGYEDGVKIFVDAPKWYA